MQKQRLILITWMIVVFLCISQVYPEEGKLIDINKMDVARALLEKYSFLAQPYSLYYFHNMDKLGLHLDWVHKGESVFPLQTTQKKFTADYSFRGERRTLDEYFKRTYVLGFLVLHDDEILLEKYFDDATPTSRFISNSMIKSIVSILIGIAIEDGKIKSTNDLVVQYLPYLEDSGFKNVSIKNLLQMDTGIQWNENYLDPDSDFNSYMMAQLRGTPSFKELAASRKSMRPPGTCFEYQSINTEVLGLLLEAVTNMPLNKYCEEKLWSKIGSDSDAFIYRGKKQPQIPAAVGFNATLRDYARFGLMVMRGGLLGNQRIVSESWIRKSTTLDGASDKPQPPGPDDAFSENLGYAYQWWLLDGADGVFMAMGIYGQTIYLNPSRHIVIVQASAWPKPDPDEYWDETLKVMNTICDNVKSSACFAEETWKQNSALYQKILNMPFNQELLNGELDTDIFKRYIIQDYIFLQNYRKVYGILLAKAPDEPAMQFILQLINGIDEEINSIHSTYIARFNISREDLLNAFPYPNTEFYSSFLIKTATIEPFEVGLIATLPCHWVYYQLGTDMKHLNKAEGNKYQEWIDGYGEEFWESSDAKKVVDFVDKYMCETTVENRNKMKQAFATAMKLEYMFWDGIYNEQRWIN